MNTATRDRTSTHGLQVASVLKTFVDQQVLPGTGLEAEAFWAGFATIVNDLAPKNAALLAERDRLQTELDAWHAKAEQGGCEQGRFHGQSPEEWWKEGV
ncbi:MAG: hypothetical protein ACKOD9_11405, partial [Rubrivivax sp.]